MPLLIQAPEREALYQLQMLRSLTHFHKPVEMYIYPNEGHVKVGPWNKYWVYIRNYDWFRFWLLGYEDPDAAKAEQDARWRELRSLQEQNEKKMSSTPK